MGWEIGAYVIPPYNLNFLVYGDNFLIEEHIAGIPLEMFFIKDFLPKCTETKIPIGEGIWSSLMNAL